jgi:hypothetical protein
VPRPAPARLATAALVLAALSVGRVVTEWLPTTPSSLRPFERDASVGATLDLRYASVRVTSVDGGRRLATSTEVKESPGVWVAVRATVEPSVDELTLGYAELRDGRGRVLTKGTRNLLQCEPANPGIEVDCIVAFEVAADAAAGSVLALTRNANDQRADDMAVVDLGITAGEVRSWQGRTAPVELDLPREDEP